MKTREEVYAEIKRLNELLPTLPATPPVEMFVVVYKSPEHSNTYHPTLESAKEEANLFSMLVAGVYKLILVDENLL